MPHIHTILKRRIRSWYWPWISPNILTGGFNSIIVYITLNEHFEHGGPFYYNEHLSILLTGWLINTSWAARHIATISEFLNGNLDTLLVFPIANRRDIHSSISKFLPIDRIDVAVSWFCEENVNWFKSWVDDTDCSLAATLLLFEMLLGMLFGKGGCWYTFSVEEGAGAACWDSCCCRWSELLTRMELIDAAVELEYSLSGTSARIILGLSLRFFDEGTLPMKCLQKEKKKSKKDKESCKGAICGCVWISENKRKRKRG